jgi:mono/diheme cytochrome c family protein
MKTKQMVPLIVFAALGVTSRLSAAGDGKALYEAKCAMCHGMNGAAKPMATGSKNFNDPAWKKETTAPAIVAIVKDGKGKMKGMGDALSAAQLAAVADYVLTLAK